MPGPHPPAGDHWSTFEAEALPHADRLFRLAMWFERDRREAEDLVQDTMVQALQSFHRYTPGTNCRAWLVAILHHVRSNRRRARMRREAFEHVEEQIGEVASFVPAVPQHVTDEDMLAALGGIPSIYQDIIVLCDVEDMSYKEIAGALEIPIGTVMSRAASRARAAAPGAGGATGVERPRGRQDVGRARMIMECRDIRPLVEAYVTGQLLVETTGAVVAHLDRCPSCRAEVDALRRLRAATRSAFANAPELAPRAEFLSTLRSSLEAQATRQAPAPARPAYRWLAVAAALLVAAGGAIGLRQWSARNLSELMDAAVGDHRYCAVTYKLSERPIALDDAANEFGAFNRTLDTVQPSSDTVDGEPLKILERHSCVFAGQRFAHLVLRFKGQLVSVVVSSHDVRGARWWGLLPRADAAGPVADVNGFHVAAFEGSGHAVFVVSSLAEEDVQRVANAIAGPVAQALAGA